MNRTISHMLVALAVALLSAPLVSLHAADTPSLAGSFPLGVYWPWERTEALAQRNGLEKWAFVERCLDGQDLVVGPRVPRCGRCGQDGRLGTHLDQGCSAWFARAHPHVPELVLDRRD